MARAVRFALNPCLHTHINARYVRCHLVACDSCSGGGGGGCTKEGVRAGNVAGKVQGESLHLARSRLFAAAAREHRRGYARQTSAEHATDSAATKCDARGLQHGCLVQPGTALRPV